MEKYVLEEYAGQKCDVIINKRDNGSIYVEFRSVHGYGYPKLELEELQNLVRKCEAMKEAE